ncbi:MAG: glutaminyl-peptide cyclotransferase, partial [Acidobacteriota bacterium]|nr:glutaminyl-peptide cyclotransferase [Acidobacteriota bacterium]
MRILVIAMALALCACGAGSDANVKVYGYKVVHTYPHDPGAFTEGLFYLNGYLYESTGLEGHSSIRKVRLETGEVVQQHDLPAELFGEGIVNWKDNLYQLTYKSEVGFVWDLGTFAEKRRFEYPGEGWSLTTDGKRIIMDDGTPEIRFWDPDTLKETGRITVTEDGQPLKNINELEWVKGEIFANVWMTDRIVRIDPATGNVKSWIDMSGLLSDTDRISADVDVLNGIAYDAKGNRLFVTGKKWPKLFEIQLSP